MKDHITIAGYDSAFAAYIARPKTVPAPAVIRQTRKLARRAVELGDDGSNDLLVSEMLRTNELQVCFLSEHLVDVPLITATA